MMMSLCDRFCTVFLLVDKLKLFAIGDKFINKNDSVLKLSKDDCHQGVQKNFISTIQQTYNAELQQIDCKSNSFFHDITSVGNQIINIAACHK